MTAICSRKIGFLVAFLMIGFSAQAKKEDVSLEVDKKAGVEETTTSIIGVNHIGLSVKNLDRMLEFYLKATEFELVSHVQVTSSKAVDTLFNNEGTAYRKAVLKAPNMLLELTEFDSSRQQEIQEMPVFGPGMTHTCYQTKADKSGYEKFRSAGLKTLSRGGTVDLGGYGVTYAYGYDPEGNMLEMEQLDQKILNRSGYDKTWKSVDHPMWMSQVALVSNDLDRIMMFYQSVLGFKPFRTAELRENKKVDDIVDIDDAHIKGGWFRLGKVTKVMEFWEFVNPITPTSSSPKSLQGLGYTFSLEVTDIKAEVKRLKALDIQFASEPVLLDGFWQVFAWDVDGNPFQLRQAADPNSDLSVTKLDIF